MNRPIERFWITMHMKNEQGNKIFSFSGVGRCYSKHHESGEYLQKCTVPANFLNWGNYAIDFMALQGSGKDSDLADEHDIISFVVTNKQVEIGAYMGKEPGDITPKFDFFEEKVK